MLGANRFSCRVALYFSMGLLLLSSGRLLAADAAQKSDAAAAEKDVTQGALRIVQPDGGVVECPLKHTDVKADVSGFIARVRVTQTFHNTTGRCAEGLALLCFGQWQDSESSQSSSDYPEISRSHLFRCSCWERAT